MIRHAFDITSPESTENTKLLLCDILRRSSYPEPLINAYIKPFTTTGLPKIISQSVRHVSCPYYRPSYNRIKSIVYQNKLNAKLAPKPVSNNRRVLFSRVKGVRDASSIKNCVFKICCSCCSFTHLFTTENLDVQRTFQKVTNDKKSPCGQHISDFPFHSMSKEVFIMKTFDNKFDTEHSRYFYKQVEELKGRRMIVG